MEKCNDTFGAAAFQNGSVVSQGNFFDLPLAYLRSSFATRDNNTFFFSKEGGLHWVMDCLNS